MSRFTNTLSLASLLAAASLAFPCAAQEPAPHTAPPAPEAQGSPASSPTPQVPSTNPTAPAQDQPATSASNPDSAAKAANAAPSSQAQLRGYISAQVSKPKDMFYSGPGSSAGMMFGAIGAAATANADHSAKGELMALMDKEHIDISTILLDQAQAKLEVTPDLDKRIKAIQGAHLQISILMYGLSKARLFSSAMYPTIKVRMVLGKEGETVPLWSESEFVATLASENDKGFSYDEYMKDPEKIRIVWTNVSKIAVSRLFESLQRKLPR